METWVITSTTQHSHVSVVMWVVFFIILRKKSYLAVALKLWTPSLILTKFLPFWKFGSAQPS